MGEGAVGGRARRCGSRVRFWFPRSHPHFLRHLDESAGKGDGPDRAVCEKVSVNEPAAFPRGKAVFVPRNPNMGLYFVSIWRSEERRVGKECGSGWGPGQLRRNGRRL